MTECLVQVPKQRGKGAMHRALAWVGGVFCLLLLWGCAARPIMLSVDVMKPAEVDLRAVRKLAITDFGGQGGSTISNKVVARLVEGRRFEILERARLTRILEELALSQSGVVDAGTAATVGKAAGVDALIFGEVETYQVEDERGVTPLRKSRVVGYDTQCDRKGRCYQVPVEEDYTINAPTTIRRGHVSASMRVVDVASGQILTSKAESTRWEGVNILDPEPGRGPTIGGAMALALMGQAVPQAQSINLPAKSAILEQLSDAVVAKLVGVISPHRVQVQTVWLPVDGTEPALKYLNAGLAKEALEHLEGRLPLAQSYPAPFYYDLGLLYEVNGRLDDAEAMYKKAAALEMNDIFLKAISSVRQAKEDQKKLAEQQRAIQ